MGGFERSIELGEIKARFELLVDGSWVFDLKTPAGMKRYKEALKENADQMKADSEKLEQQLHPSSGSKS